MPGRCASRSGLPPTACDRSIFAPTRSRPTNILLALRLKDLTYSADLPLTGELKGELGRDGLPTYFRGKITHRRRTHHRQRYARLSDGDRFERK